MIEATTRRAFVPKDWLFTPMRAFWRDFANSPLGRALRYEAEIEPEINRWHDDGGRVDD